MAEKNTVNITISVTKEERKALKQMALDNDTTLSALIRKWLKEHNTLNNKNERKTNE